MLTDMYIISTFVYVYTWCAFGSKLKGQLIFAIIHGPRTLHFLVLFIGFTILFQLIFTFTYSTFSKKFLVLAK